MHTTLFLALLAFASHADASARPVAAAASAAQESVDALVARGRALLREGKTTEALDAFTQAAKQDNDSLRTRVWVLRTWQAQGRINDAMAATEKLERDGAKGPEIDYLFGVGFALRAKEQLASGGGMIDANFIDATTFLTAATKADPERFSDAFPLLAESAWHTQKLDVARQAADKAVEMLPSDPDVRVQHGKICMSQFAVANADETQKAAAEKLLGSAHASFAKAVELLAGATSSVDRAKLAQAHVQLAYCYGWKQKGDEQAKEYAAALALDPSAVDLAQVRGSLTPEQFARTLEEATKSFAAANGAADAGDATMLWWLGFARFEQKEYAKAEEAFVAAVTKWPQYYNSWWFTALSRYHQQKYDDAIAALRKNFEANPEDLVASINSNRELNVGILGYLTGRAFNAKPQRLLDAAFLAEVLTNVDPTNSRNWNDMGLFLRDEGERRMRSKKDEDKDAAVTKDLMERAYVAYRKALELAPDDPNYLNDTALMLHYHLDRDLDQARAWYVKAAQKAEEELARKDLTPDVREIRQIALRDAKNNLADLDRILEERKKAAEKKDDPKQEGTQGG